MKIPVLMENDAASAVLAEHWLGAARGKDNAVLLTLGTGLGVGMIHNGKLLRAGRGLHTEGGHMIMDRKDKTAKCGCGNYGCAEAFLSGKNFTIRAQKSLRRPKLRTQELIALAQTKKSALIKGLFAEYSDIMATFIHNLVVLHAPDIIVFSGSFALAHPLFLPRTKKALNALLRIREKTIKTIPEIQISPLENHAGILGRLLLLLLRIEIVFKSLV